MHDGQLRCCDGACNGRGTGVCSLVGDLGPGTGSRNQHVRLGKMFVCFGLFSFFIFFSCQHSEGCWASLGVG